MLFKKNILILIFAAAFWSCTATRVSSKNNQLPTKSFVKIFQTTKINSCPDNYKGKCPKGIYGQTGSGMAVDVFKNQTTVLTAGHVCDSQPDPKIVKDYIQHIYVIDYLETKHQAWKVHVSFDNGIGKGDLCLLWVPTLEVKKIKLSFFRPKIGDELYYIGSPLGIHHPPTVPIFKGIYSGKLNASSAMVTFPAIGGSSGAAVLDKNLRIVGVVFAANQRFHHITLITTFESLKLFIMEAKEKFSNTQ